MIANHLVRLPAEESHVGGSALAQSGFILPGADDHEFPAQFAAGIQRQVNSLVGRERGDNEIVLLAPLIRGSVEVGINGWINDGAVAVVTLLDAPLDRVADGEEVIHRARCAAIPVAQVSKQLLNQAPLQPTNTSGEV